MQTTEFVIPYRSKTDVFKIWAIGDVHIGAKNVHRERFEATLKEIAKDKNSYIVLLGDLVDAITMSDRRFDMREIDPRYSLEEVGRIAEKQMEDVYEYLKPVQDKVICMITGNHEHKLAQRTGYDISRILANKMNVPMLGYSGFARLIFRRKSSKNNPCNTHSYTIYMHHGRGGGRSGGSGLNNLDKLPGMFDADIYMMGHIHRQIIDHKPILYMDRGGNIKERYKVLMNSGSYLRTYGQGSTGYGEVGQYPPSVLGSVYVEIAPHTGRMKANFNDGPLIQIESKK
jgi:UDP-2,3-diacylglucosamine pyrophosphatase LpxH